MNVVNNTMDSIRDHIWIPVRNVTERTFYGFKKLTDSFEGVIRLANVVSPVCSLLACCLGEEMPSWPEVFNEDLKSVRVIKSGLGWVGTGHDLHTKEWSEGLIGTAKRIISIVLTVLFTCDYLQRIVKGLTLTWLTTVAEVPLKLVFLEISTILNLINGCLSWRKHIDDQRQLESKIDLVKGYKNLSNVQKLTKRISRRLKELNDSLKDLQSLDRSQYKNLQNEKNMLQKKMAATEIKLINRKDGGSENQKKNYSALKSEFDKVSKKLNDQFKLRQIKFINSAPKNHSYLALKKKAEMLKLITDLNEEKLKDVNALNNMDGSEYKLYKMKQFARRQNNLSLADTSNKMRLVGDAISMVSFGLGIGKAYYGIKVLTGALQLNEATYKFGMDCLSLISGCLGIGKFFHNDRKELPELRPSACAA